MSKVDRRRFIGTAVALGTAVATGGSALGQVASLARKDVGRDALSRLSWGSFLPFVNTDFTFGLGRNSVVLRLADIQDLRTPGSRAIKSGMEQFILRFTGPSRTPLIQNTYRVNHFGLGSFGLFITEGGTTGRLRNYYAIVDRVTVPEE